MMILISTLLHIYNVDDDGVSDIYIYIYGVSYIVQVFENDMHVYTEILH